MTSLFDPSSANVFPLRQPRSMQIARLVAERQKESRFVGENTGAGFYRPGDTPATMMAGQTTKRPPK